MNTLSLPPSRSLSLLCFSLSEIALNVPLQVDHFIERLWTPLFRSDKIDCSSNALFNEVGDELDLWREIAPPRPNGRGKGVVPRGFRHRNRKSASPTVVLVILFLTFGVGLFSMFLIYRTADSPLSGNDIKHLREQRRLRRSGRGGEDGDQLVGLYLGVILLLFLMASIISIFLHYLLEALH
jgi:hypothetical protein